MTTLTTLADAITAALLDRARNPCVAVAIVNGRTRVTVIYSDGADRVTCVEDFAASARPATIVNNVLLAVLSGSGEREPFLKRAKLTQAQLAYINIKRVPLA